MKLYCFGKNRKKYCRGEEVYEVFWYSVWGIPCDDIVNVYSCKA